MIFPIVRGLRILFFGSETMKRLFVISMTAISIGAFAQGYSIGSVAEIRQKITQEAVVWKGVPYVYGGSAPSGFDCSGYTQYVYRKVAGIELPRRAKDQYKVGVAVTEDKLQIGDLLIFDTIGGPSHVGIYLGNGDFSHAASEGTPSGIKISKLTSDGYNWKKKLLTGRAIISAPQGPSSNAKPEPQRTPPPQNQAPPSEPEIPVSTMGFTVGPKVLIYNDSIPAYTGTKAEFNVMNKTGVDAQFELIIVKGDYDSGAYSTLWTGKKSIKKDAYVTTPEFSIDTIDYYQLVVKGTDGNLRGKRAFKSIPQK
jgi:hypothetical protein